MTRRGFTLLEMALAATVLAVFASGILPLAMNKVRRDRELQLRRALLELRAAIDGYRAAALQNAAKGPPPANDGYPASLEALVEGVTVPGKEKKVRLLRRIPTDPFTGKAEWGLRSMADDPDSATWGGGDVFDVHSLAPGEGANGIAYRHW
ncbi:type II secretion system protein [Geothrix sp. 21YS21S-2]|uniref:type II secretion system protein n=1 Tax=Geothrix sp. 21YS21S-2 TaxID=3068893 RepID=UPI0027B91C4B|nr:type II secretion system protein [Geothrix sp. 21YS21S-2]